MQQTATVLIILGLAVLCHAADPVKEWTGKPWMGKWETTGRQENMEQYVSKLALHTQSNVHSHADPNAKTITKFFKLGDQYHHHMIVQAANYSNDIAFKLNEEGSGIYGGVNFKFKYVEQDGALVGTFTFGDKVAENTYKLDGEELVKIGKIDGIVAKRWYKKCSPSAQAAKSA